jgi:hypothetical protein
MTRPPVAPDVSMAIRSDLPFRVGRKPIGEDLLFGKPRYPGRRQIEAIQLVMFFEIPDCKLN